MIYPLIPRQEPAALAEWSRRRGLPMTICEASMLLSAHSDALRSTGRIEFESGTLEALIEAFAPSPFLDGAEELCELTALFFHLKNITGDLIPDELLLQRMAEVFDDCHGSVQLLADRLEGGLSCRN